MDGAKRIINAMKAISSANQNSTSDIVSLTVQSTEPLIFRTENRLDINDKFYSLSKVENWNGLKKGDIVRAFKMNNGQSYYVNEILDGEGSSDNIKNIEETLIQLVEQVSIMSDEIEKINDKIDKLDKRVTALENK